MAENQAPKLRNQWGSPNIPSGHVASLKSQLPTSDALRTPVRKWNGDVALLASPDKVARRKEQFNSPVPDPSRRPLSSQPPSSGGWRAAASPAPSPAPPAPCTPPSPVPDAISPAALVCSAAPEPRQMIDTAFASLAESDWSADGLGERMSMIVRSSGVVCRANSGASPQASSPKRSAVWR